MQLNRFMSTELIQVSSLICDIVFWVCLALVLLTYVGYSGALLALQPFRRRPTFSGETPSVSLVISAYNEESVIREKLQNSLDLDYPRDQLEIIVVSDESTDRTDDIVESFAEQRVVLYRQSPRNGKSAGLTRFVPHATGELIVFSDANSMYQPDAVRKLVRHFSDSRVGFVSGHQRYYEDDNAAAESESLYWRYETAVKVLESRVGSVVCGDGAICAIRRELFEPLAADDINDFSLPLRIIIQGYRGVFDKDAVCYEHAASEFSGEFRRRVRIVNRSFLAVCRNWRALSPFHVGTFAAQLLLHKVVRWFVPFLLLLTLITNGWLVAAGSGSFYTGFLGLQVVCYLLALAFFVPAVRDVRPVYVCAYFCLANVAAGLGILTFLCGRRFSTWTPEREQPLQAEAATVRTVA
jgi:cellulose synthase/poly-beta-1,6-N-acetylglucosamine synthase-like glycosyltransferase